MFEWEMRVQAMQNQVFIAMCNRVGTEDKMQFAGESIVIDPRGKVLAKADDREQLLVCDIDLQEVKKSEAVWIIYHFEDLSSMINKGENKKMAKLYFRYGAMGSSKSANILMVRYNYEERGQYAILLNQEQTTGMESIRSSPG